LRQRSAVTLKILVVFVGFGPNNDMTAEVDDAREGIKNALLGKILADMDDPIELVVAAVEEADFPNSFLVYSLVFSTAYHIRRNA
jgi:hypothetical protein